MAQPDYVALAEKAISRPAERSRKPKLLIYGRNKKGKTTFCISAGVNSILIVDPEGGTDESKKSNPHTWPISSYEDLENVYRYLVASKGKCPRCKGTDAHTFSWVALDGMTRINNMAIRYVKDVRADKSLSDKPILVEKRDYGRAGELMRELVIKFCQLDLGVVFTAQERQVEADDMEEDEDAESQPSWYVPDLPKGARGILNSMVDVIARIYVVNVDDAEGNNKPERRLWIAPSEKYDTGYRSDFELPSMLPRPTIARLVTLMRRGTLAAKRGNT